ncbi:Mycobacterium rhizamassiliense ORFan [Mycobacterium rhizamassiliense]|jgi:hypothetical protein|uniref:Mycobacterium rhizamassiliense ORFan n=1 Tax=Mycobacterium rhizamassiliense TaxID=1841860 RepID=A0A2U3NYU2_9MYCO|nr:hypothetical protein [Mycobacterium rhizamassiliense]SPM36656.1 Mycobacterium rhizamassiliense ORFan [Mycobacterium rhizamassiliense]
MITKLVAGTAIVLGLSMFGAAPANADPSQSDPNPNPFAGLTCNCQPQGPFVGPDFAEMERGMQAALAR